MVIPPKSVGPYNLQSPTVTHFGVNENTDQSYTTAIRNK